MQCFQISARQWGSLKEVEALVDQCMSHCDEDGWRDPAYHNEDGVLMLNNAK